ncbi:MAG: hypothetical protein ACFFG0_41285, partial [Candidatus Thorarchaeota archaeon]
PPVPSRKLKNDEQYAIIKIRDKEILYTTRSKSKIEKTYKYVQDNAIHSKVIIRKIPELK